MVVEIEEITQDVYNVTVETVNPDMAETIDRIEGLVSEAELSASESRINANNANQYATQANTSSISAQNSASQALIYRNEAEQFAEQASQGGSASWNSIEGKPNVIGAGATQEEARTAIGAGTSNYGFPSDGTNLQVVLGDNTLKTATELVSVISSYDINNPNTAYTARFVTGNSFVRDVTSINNKWTYTAVTANSTLTVASFNTNSTITYNGTNITVTIPLNANAAIPIGCAKEFINLSDTPLNIVAISGVTLTSAGGLTKVVNGGSFKLWKTATNTWHLTGNLTS